MKIVVTGGAGFIGSHLVDRLLADGHRVTVVDNFEPFYNPVQKRANLRSALANSRCHLVELDIQDRAQVRKLVRANQPEAIVHLAARAGVRPSIADPVGYAATNIIGTLHLLEAVCELRPLPRFVFASSSSVYGNRSVAPFRESDVVDQPVSPYAATKKAVEVLVYTYHHLHGLPATGLRFFTAYGPRNRPDLAIARFADLMESGKPIPMFGDGTTRRDYTYVDDLIEGIVRAVDRCSGYHIYNLGHAEPVLLGDMIRMLGDALGVSPLLDRLPEQAGDVQQTYADISLAQRELGYEPTTSFQEGLRHYVAWRRGDGYTSLKLD